MNNVNELRIQSTVLLCTLFVLGASLYFQYVQGLTPCPLCLMQRFCVFAFLLICSTVVMTKHHKLIKRCYIIQLCIALAGAYFATRQLWLQSLPEGSSLTCMPGLEIMMQYFPWSDIIKALFWGSAECAETNWSWLGISMAGWSLVYFIAMIAASLYLFLRYRSNT